MIKAIIFDCDGLIIDTETPWYEAYKHVYNELNVELPLEIWGKCIGTSFDEFDPHVYLEEQFGAPVDRDEIKQKTKTQFTTLMHSQKLRPGVQRYLQDAKQLGLKIGLASSSTRRWVESYLTEHGIIHYFDEIFTSNDVSKVKPDPELYVKTMEALQVEGNETIVFEDSLNGLNAAKAAGAYCVVVPNQVTSFMDFRNEDLKISSMEEMTLQEVIERVGAPSQKISLEAFNNLAESYFNDVDTKPYNAYYERPAVLSLLPDVKDKAVLDAACAAGWYTEWLMNHGANVTAIDFSPNMIEMTKKRVGDKAAVIQADLNQPLDFLRDGQFDVIVSSLTLHYLKDWDLVLAEFHRVLKHNGVLVFSVHHPFMDYTVFNRENYFLTELLTDEWKTGNGKEKVQFYRRPLQDIVAPLLSAGFAIDALNEPMPTDAFKEKSPETYDKLTKRPQFLFLRARKNE